MKPVAANLKPVSLSDGSSATSKKTRYRLDEQIGFVLRRAFQRHSIIFQDQMAEGLTPTQFAAMVRLKEAGQCSQNHLGRLTAMDIATIKGVVDRLKDRGLVTIEPDEVDRRRRSLALTEAGLTLINRAIPKAVTITADTLAPLNKREQAQLLDLLSRIA